MDFLQTINKEDLSLLPIEEFPGRVIVVDTERDTEKAISYLSTFKEVGFDTETRPNFKKGQWKFKALWFYFLSLQVPHHG